MPPVRRTRSPTRNGRALVSTVPAKTLPSVCCAASPSTTAVKAPPTASAFASSPAIRSATTTIATIVSRRIMKPTVPAVPGSIRRKSAGAMPSPERPRQGPAEDHQQRDGRDPHRRREAGEEGLALAEEDQHAGDQEQRGRRTAPRARCAWARSTSPPSPTWRHCSVRLSNAGRLRRRLPRSESSRRLNGLRPIDND